MGQPVSVPRAGQGVVTTTGTQAVHQDALPGSDSNGVVAGCCIVLMPVVVTGITVVLMITSSSGALVALIFAFILLALGGMCFCALSDARRNPRQRSADSHIEGYRARVATLRDKEKRRTLFHYFVPRPPDEESAERGGVGRSSSDRETGMGVNNKVHDGEGAAESCIICFGDFASGEELCRLPCCHMYHAKCIDEWLNTGNHHWCPLCKTDVFAAAAFTPQAAGSSRNNSTSTSTPVINSNLDV